MSHQISRLVRASARDLLAAERHYSAKGLTMTSDTDTGLVERLRHIRRDGCYCADTPKKHNLLHPVCLEAADTIERLQAELATLSRPSADFAAVVEQCARVAEQHKPDRKRPLSAYDPDDRVEIQAEERGERIAAGIIAAAIRSIQAPDEGGGL